MGTKADEQAADYRAEAIRRTEIDLPPTPEPSVTRVTLEFTGGHRAHPTQWPWDLILSGACVVRREPGESVRVVEEPSPFSAACPIAGGTVKVNGKDMVTLTEFLRHTAKLTQEAGVAKRERDAAIRERDEFRRSFHWSEEAGTRLVAERDASHDDADGLRILVAELEAERDGLQVDVSALMDVGHRLGSQVASLELQLESVACRAATAETALESAPPPASGWLTEEERDFFTKCRGIAEQVRKDWERLCSTHERDEAAETVKFLDALLARSSPPEVVRPGTQVRYHRLSVEEQRDDQWLAALAAAGVAVKEVGK